MQCFLLVPYRPLALWKAGCPAQRTRVLAITTSVAEYSSQSTKSRKDRVSYLAIDSFPGFEGCRTLASGTDPIRPALFGNTIRIGNPLNPVRGITLKVLSVIVFVTMFSFIKATSQGIPAGEAVFFRSVFAIPVLLIWLIVRGDFPHKLKARDPIGHVWRGLMGTFAMASGFLAIGLLPLPEVVAIGYAAPLLVTMLAAMFLGEKIRLVRLSALLLGLLGVMLILSPRLTVFDEEVTSRLQTIGALAALMGAMFSALAQVFARKLVATETTGSIVFYFSIMSSVLSLLTLPFGWNLPDAREAFLLITAGLLGGVGQILLTESYRHAEVAVIAPFEYCSILLALLVGYFIFDELPTGIMIIGVALIIIAGIIIIARERRLGIKRTGKARSTVPNQG